MPGSQVTRCAVGWESLAYSGMEAAGAWARAVGAWVRWFGCCKRLEAWWAGCCERLGYWGRGSRRLGHWAENCAELGRIACNCVRNHACKEARCVANGE